MRFPKSWHKKVTGTFFKGHHVWLYNSIMSITAYELSTEALKKYRPLEAIRRRRVRTGAELAKRRRLANLTARKAAKLLRAEFGAKEVILFGSLTRRGSFTLFSDIDIAVRGISPERFFAAVGAVTSISLEFNIDLVDMETCSPQLYKTIEAEGKPL